MVSNHKQAVSVSCPVLCKYRLLFFAPAKGGPAAAIEALTIQVSPNASDRFLLVKHERIAIQEEHPTAPSASP